MKVVDRSGEKTAKVTSAKAKGISQSPTAHAPIRLASERVVGCGSRATAAALPDSVPDIIPALDLPGDEAPHARWRSPTCRGQSRLTLLPLRYDDAGAVAEGRDSVCAGRAVLRSEERRVGT